MFKRILIASLIALLSLTVFIGCNGEKAAPDSGGDAEASVSDQADSDAGLYAKYLTVADVEGTTGMSGLTLEEVDLTLKFYNGDGTEILETRFYDSSFYEEEVGGNQEYYTDVPDLGEKAAICIPDMPYRVTFQQGDYGIMVQTIPQGTELPVTEEQLIAIAKIVSSRL